MKAIRDYEAGKAQVLSPRGHPGLSHTVVIKGPLYSCLRHLAPEPRRAMKKALKGLCDEKGDIRSLDQNLAGYYRLRVGKHRIIFRYGDDNAIDALFAEERNLVYEVFEEQLIKQLKSLKGLTAGGRGRTGEAPRGTGSVLHQPVADSRLGPQVPGPVGLGLELLADVGHVDPKVVGVLLGLGPPELPEHLPVGHHLAPVDRPASAASRIPSP